jgi:hypothetical protein
MTLLGFERRWLLAIFEAVVPTGPDSRLPASAARAPMGRFLDDLVRHAPAHFVLGLRACMWALMLAPPFVLGRMATFMGLSSVERLALLERLGRSDVYVVREMPLLFKTVACLGLCGLPDVQGHVGISPVDASPPAWARNGLPLVGSDR